MSSRSTFAALTLLPLILPSTGLAIEATGLDAITTPGQPVEVRAKFERSGFWLHRPDVKREPVTLSVLGRRLAARTDQDGVARATLTPASVGVFPISATLDRKAGAPAARQGRLWVIDPARPLAIIDIDLTISDLPEWQVPFVGHRAPAFADAPAVLRELSRRAQIVYLTAPDDTFDGKTRAFLRRHAFPDGPIIYDDLGLTTRGERTQLDDDNHGQYKLDVLRALQARGLRPSVGIGNTATDAFAYEGAGLRSYLLNPAAPSAGSTSFRTYADLRARLVADGVLVDVTGLATSVP